MVSVKKLILLGRGRHKRWTFCRVYRVSPVQRLYQIC